MYVGDEEAESKSIFVKVPLKDDPTFASVNVRELVMFTDVLPKLQVNHQRLAKPVFALQTIRRDIAKSQFKSSISRLQLKVTTICSYFKFAFYTIILCFRS